MKIIHVDDHQLFVAGLRALLEHERHGYQVISAATGEDAITLIEQHFDAELMLVDLTLPGMDGHALIKACFERNFIVPVIVMSGVEDLWQIKRCMDAGAVGFIPKSASTDDIVIALQTVLSGDTYLPIDLEEKIANLPSETEGSYAERTARSLRVSKRQMEVLKLIRDGYGNQEIANILCLSEHTIKSHTRALFQVLDVSNRIECVRSAERIGLLS